MKGDFLGFSFDGIHSSSLGFTRVSDGDRYEEELFPEIKDISDEIIGNDGENFYESTFGTRSLTINIAFDSMTETQFRRMRRLFGTRKICELIFDERPYKVYQAKLANPIELEYVCFDEPFRYEGEARDGVRVAERSTHTEIIIDEETGEEKEIIVTDITREQVTPLLIDQTRKQRIYKGEGTIEFVCYYPFARQLYKILDLYETNNIITQYENVDEWAESSGLLTEELYKGYNIDKTLLFTGTAGYNLKIPVYNPGDLNTGFYLYIPFGADGKIEPLDATGNETPYIRIMGDENGMLLRTIQKKTSAETGIMINSVNHLIEGVQYDPITERNNHRTKSWIRTKTLYNECIVAGDFPKILKSDWYFDDDQFKQAIYIGCKLLDGDITEKEGVNEYTGLIQINYDYLYF